MKWTSKMLIERTLLEKAARSQCAPGEVGAAPYAIPKRRLKVELIHGRNSINK